MVTWLLLRGSIRRECPLDWMSFDQARRASLDCAVDDQGALRTRAVRAGRMRTAQRDHFGKMSRIVLHRLARRWPAGVPTEDISVVPPPAAPAKVRGGLMQLLFPVLSAMGSV